MPELSGGRFLYGSSKPPPHDREAERRREAALRTVRPDFTPTRLEALTAAAIAAAGRQPEPQKREDQPMTEKDAILIAKANDAYRVRRDFINAHPELSKIPSAYSELMPATTSVAELGAAATQIMQKYNTEFVPLARAAAEQRALQEDADRRANLKTKLMANGEMTEAAATFAANLRMPGDVGYVSAGAQAVKDDADRRAKTMAGAGMSEGQAALTAGMRLPG